jgi:hypothetical protein
MERQDLAAREAQVTCSRGDQRAETAHLAEHDVPTGELVRVEV